MSDAKYIPIQDAANSAGITKRDFFLWRKRGQITIYQPGRGLGHYVNAAAWATFQEHHADLIELAQARLLARLRSEAVGRTQLELALDGGEGGADLVDNQRTTRSPRKPRTRPARKGGKT